MWHYKYKEAKNVKYLFLFDTRQNNIDNASTFIYNKKKKKFNK